MERGGKAELQNLIWRRSLALEAACIKISSRGTGRVPVGGAISGGTGAERVKLGFLVRVPGPSAS